MQRAAQRDDRDDQRVQRDRRTGWLRSALVCAAAVPVVFAAAGCSSDSGSSDAKDSADAGQTASSGGAETSVSPTPTVEPAAYRKLPEACDVLSKKTLGELVPKGSKSGKEAKSGDIASRAGCSWNSLDNNGVKGSQFRWLNVSLLRFDSNTTQGSGEERAKAYYGKQVQGAQAVSGAKNTKSEPVTGAGDEATAVRYDLKKKEGSFKQQTVVVRVENVVVTLDYNGAGLAGEKAPDADALTKSAKKAAAEAADAVAEANGAGGTATASPSKSASKPATKSPSASSSKSASKSSSKSTSKSASKSASPSKSAVKKH